MCIKLRKPLKFDLPKIIHLLKENLSPFEPVESEYENIWNNYISQPNVHSLVACVDDNVVGFGTVLIEKKIRGSGIAHIEDIVCSSSMRRKGVGSSILERLFLIAKEHNCYKAVLACQPHNVDFYSENGYHYEGLSMVQFIDITK